MDLSIVTINFNTPKLLSNLLESLDKIRLADELDFEVILVNVTPEDGSEIMVKRSFPWVKQIVDRRNLGFSGNNNLGIAQSSGRYILFLNSDTTVPQGTLSEMVRFMDQPPGNQPHLPFERNLDPNLSGERHRREAVDLKQGREVFDSPDGLLGRDRPNSKSQEGREVGAATCYIELATGGMDPDCHRGFPTPWASLTHFLGLEKLFPKSKLFGQYHQFYLPLNETHEIDACAGAFLMIRREVGGKIDLASGGEGKGLSSKEFPELSPGEFAAGTTEKFGVSDLGFRICGRSIKSRHSEFISESDGNRKRKRPLWWDEDFFFYGEDLDLCYRIKEAGYKIMFYPHVKIMHHKGASSGIRKESKEITKASKETKQRVLRETTRAMKLFYQKHYENKYPRIVTALVYLGIAILEKLRGLK